MNRFYLFFFINFYFINSKQQPDEVKTTLLKINILNQSSNNKENTQKLIFELMNKYKFSVKKIGKSVELQFFSALQPLAKKNNFLISIPLERSLERAKLKNFELKSYSNFLYFRKYINYFEFLFEKLNENPSYMFFLIQFPFQKISVRDNQLILTYDFSISSTKNIFSEVIFEESNYFIYENYNVVQFFEYIYICLKKLKTLKNNEYFLNVKMVKVFLINLFLKYEFEIKCINDEFGKKAIIIKFEGKKNNNEKLEELKFQYQNENEFVDFEEEIENFNINKVFLECFENLIDEKELSKKINNILQILSLGLENNIVMNIDFENNLIVIINKNL